MGSSVADFHKELKDLCRKHQVWLHSVRRDEDRPGGQPFYRWELSKKQGLGEEGETEVVLMESDRKK